MEQIIRELTSSTKNRIDSQRKWVRDHYLPDSISEYNSIEGKLKLLNTILQSDWIGKDETNKLQCLGVTLGDVIVQKCGFRWVEVEDDLGTDPALKLLDTSIILFPVTMISKRIENGETVNIYDLFERIENNINELINTKN